MQAVQFFQRQSVGTQHMSNQKTIIALIKSLSGQSNVLTIPRVFVTLTKSHRAALVLSQCIYWSDKSTMTGGWFYKSYREWHDELGIPKSAMINAVRVLVDMGLLQTRVQRNFLAPTCHYWVDLEAVAKQVKDVFDSVETVRTIVRKPNDG